jgi:predicted exporter
MTRHDAWIVTAGAIAFLILVGYSASHLKISTNITHFLPDTDDPRLAEVSRQVSESSLTRTMILSIEAPEAAETRAAARQLSEALQSQPEILRIRSGPGEGLVEAAYDLLFPHRYQLRFDEPEQEWPALLAPGGISASATELKRQLASPAAIAIKRIAGADPLLAFPALLERLAGLNSGSLNVVNGQFVTEDGRRAILFLETRHSPFDGTVQAPLLLFIRQAFERVNGAHGGRIRLEQSGLNRFAVDSEHIVRRDIDRISGFSTIAIIGIFLVLFRSIRILLLSFLPLLFGMAAGVAASMAFFGEIHGLTLAFGSTLIGVCVDYPIHFLNHHSLIPAPTGPSGTRRRIAWALILGAVTTLAGFVGLACTSFPGMRELALFASAGILAALAATYWLLPPLSLRVPPRVALHQACAAAAGRLLDRMGRSRSKLVALPLLALLLCAVGLPRVKWSDDLSSLNRVDDAMRAEDERVRGEVSRMDSSRLIVATAPDDAQATALNDRVYTELVAAQRMGELHGFSSLHSLVTSEDLQRRNVAAMRSDPAAPGRVLAGFAALGFRPESFAAFEEAFTQPAPRPLALATVLQSQLGDLARPFRAELGRGVGLVTLVRGVTLPGALRARMARIAGVYYFDQADFFARIYGRYRRRTFEVVALGILAMLGIVFLKYRALGPTLAAGLPALTAAATTLAILGLAGVVTNLLHVVSLLFVLSAGEDYAVFLLESAQDPSYLRASAVSIALCCFATVLGFGLLGLSSMPALRAVGVTTSIGVLVGLLMAPTALLLARPRGGQR